MFDGKGRPSACGKEPHFFVEMGVGVCGKGRFFSRFGKDALWSFVALIVCSSVEKKGGFSISEVFYFNTGTLFVCMFDSALGHCSVCFERIEESLDTDCRK